MMTEVASEDSQASVAVWPTLMLWGAALMEIVGAVLAVDEASED